jgi:ferredoxin-thioredoxin reductase catalytic chain
LYVSERVSKGEHMVGSIPERRPPREERLAAVKEKGSSGKVIPGSLAYPVWRCKVCGYLAARDNPPGICPICKATKERFEEFM